MLNFSEFLWERAEKQFVEVCDTLKLDPKDLILEFFEQEDQNSIGHQVLRSMNPNAQERNKFKSNVKYANNISDLISQGIPGMLRNAYTNFMQRNPNQPKDKVQDFFNSVAKRMDSWVKTTMGKAKTTVGDTKWAVNSPYMNDPIPLATPVEPTSPPQPPTPTSPNPGALPVPNPTPPNPTSPNPGALPVPNSGKSFDPSWAAKWAAKWATNLPKPKFRKAA